MDNIDKFRLISGDLNLWRDMYKNICNINKVWIKGYLLNVLLFIKCIDRFMRYIDLDYCRYFVYMFFYF